MTLGAMLAEAMRRGGVRSLYLSAPLGGGKTTLVRGFAAALPGGSLAEVASPSFTLCNEYPTSPRILHADLYRLPDHSALPEEIEDSLDEGEAIIVLEWPERLRESSKAVERIDLQLIPAKDSACKYLDNENKTCETLRTATLSACGTAAEKVLEGLRTAIAERFTN